MDNVWARFFPHDFRERAFKSRQNPRVDFFLGKKRLRRIQNGIFPFTVAVLWSIDRLQLPFICVEDAVSFSNKKHLAQNSKFIYDKQIWKQMFAEILRFK